MTKESTDLCITLDEESDNNSEENIRDSHSGPSSSNNYIAGPSSNYNAGSSTSNNNHVGIIGANNSADLPDDISPGTTNGPITVAQLRESVFFVYNYFEATNEKGFVR